MEQPYPTSGTEKRIIVKHMEKFNKKDLEFAELLTIWSETIRKTFEDGGVDDLVSTRRLCHIVQTYSIFGDRNKAIELCVNRFDQDTKEAFIDLYQKVDGTTSEQEPTVETNQDTLNEIIEEIV
jgi:hypothetical protein